MAQPPQVDIGLPFTHTLEETHSPAQHPNQNNLEKPPQADIGLSFKIESWRNTVVRKPFVEVNNLVQYAV